MTPLKVAIVGHTNTGKTSLMRTLLRDVAFGEVSDRPATTRHVEAAAVLIDQQPVLELFDTPGLEDSIGLRDHLDSIASDRRAEGIDQVREFLESPQAAHRFSQEAKALRQVLASDLALYIIDVRDRMLGKHRDELEILRRCVRPIVPVLNFIASPDAQTQQWREQLRLAGLHAVAEFDTVVFDEAGERRLFETIRTLADAHHSQINQLIAERDRQRHRLIHASAILIAELLVDAAAFSLVVPEQSKAGQSHAVEQLKERIRTREQRCVRDLLELHRFSIEDCQSDQIPIESGRWGIDLFSPAALKQTGVAAGAGAAAGAATGVALDVMFGGLTLGAWTVLGAAVGAAIGGVSRHGRRLARRARGMIELRCDNATLNVLASRQAWLARALLMRGHAAVAPLHMAKFASADFRAVAPLLNEAQLHSSWSSLSSDSPLPAAAARRDTVIAAVAQIIERQISRAHPTSA